MRLNLQESKHTLKNTKEKTMKEIDPVQLAILMYPCLSIIKPFMCLDDLKSSFQGYVRVYFKLSQKLIKPIA